MTWNEKQKFLSPRFWGLWCGHCKSYKREGDFHKGNRLHCKFCASKFARASYHKNPGRYLDQKKVYQAKNREKINEYARGWVKRSPSRKKRDVLSRTISKYINRTLNGTKNGKSWQRLVGYTLEELKKHLEGKFTKRMKWENRGSYWHIDHIIPLAKFNITGPDCVDFKTAWALENLRPLTAKKNIAKGAKYEGSVQLRMI